MTTTLTLLQAAVAARVADWDASRALELHLGLDDVPDDIDKVIQDEINGLASGYPVLEGPVDGSCITGEHVAHLNLVITRAS